MVQLDIGAVVVYVVGGGSLSEYELMDQVSKNIKKQIIYGCDYLYTGSEFVNELKLIHS